jgi:hypothetical protein
VPTTAGAAWLTGALASPLCVPAFTVPVTAAWKVLLFVVFVVFVTLAGASSARGRLHRLESDGEPALFIPPLPLLHSARA